MQESVGLFSIILIAIGVAMDCFAVSLGIGTGEFSRSRRGIFRIMWHFGLFQGGMTLLGWLAGSTIMGFISTVDHWIAFSLLAWVGIRMIKSGFSKEQQSFMDDPTRGKTLVVLSIATSIDAMAVGLSMALLDVNIWLACALIGGTSLLFSFAGLMLGKGLGILFGKRMELLGGAILIVIGLRIVITHMFAV